MVYSCLAMQGGRIHLQQRQQHREAVMTTFDKRED